MYMCYGYIFMDSSFVIYWMSVECKYTIKGKDVSTKADS